MNKRIKKKLQKRCHHKHYRDIDPVEIKLWMYLSKLDKDIRSYHDRKADIIVTVP